MVNNVLMAFSREDYIDDPLSGLSATIRRVQPYQATKLYRCPGCNNEIGIGIGHVVIVPLGRADERRHWHHSCWNRQTTRRTGR